MSVDVRTALRRVIEERRSSVLSCTAHLACVTDVGNGFARIRLQGDALASYRDPRPADAVKLHLPGRAGDPVPVPRYDERSRLVWPDGPRPLARCFTVRASDPDETWIELDALIHDDGATTRWLDDARIGDQVSLTGWRTEYVADPSATHQLLVADRSAEPAVVAIRASLPDDVEVTLLVADDPHDVCESARTCPLGPGTQVWLGAEKEVARQVRRILLRERHLPPESLHASAYWKRDEDWESMFDGQLDRVLRAARDGRDVGDPGVLQSLALD